MGIPRRGDRNSSHVVLTAPGGGPAAGLASASLYLRTLPPSEQNARCVRRWGGARRRRIDGSVHRISGLTWRRRQRRGVPGGADYIGEISASCRPARRAAPSSVCICIWPPVGRGAPAAARVPRRPVG